MAKKRAKKKVVEVETTSEARDAAMARLAAARTCAAATLETIDEAIRLFVDTVDDPDGGERTELIDAAMESAGMISRALEAAADELEEVDPEECEPWDEDSEDEDDENDEDEDDDE